MHNSKSVLNNLLKSQGFRFSKSLGQNFLVDKEIPKKIAETCIYDENTGVLEIGPGAGVLTKELCSRAEKVVAVELDPSLKPVLAKVLSPYSNVTVVWDDILKLNLSDLFSSNFSGMDVVVCANLPYYITTPVIMRFLESGLPIKSMTLMVQKEVAERLCAKPGKNSGAITLAVAYKCSAEMLFTVPAESFFPVPKVTSAVIRLTFLKKPPVNPKDSAFMFGIIRAAFSQRRKTLQNALFAAYSTFFTKAEIAGALTNSGLYANIRGEALSLEQFSVLSDNLMKYIK